MSFCAPRQAVALLVLLVLPALSPLASCAHAGLIHYGEISLQISPDGSDDQLGCGTELLQTGLPDREAPADEIPARDLLALHGPPAPAESTATPSASSSSGPATGPAVFLAAHREPPAPARAAYLIVRHKSFIPDPALSSLFRPPRSARLG